MIVAAAGGSLWSSTGVVRSAPVGTANLRGASVIRVGPRRQLASLKEAARVAVDGSLVLIDAGEYVGDVAIWPQNDLEFIRK